MVDTEQTTAGTMAVADLDGEQDTNCLKLYQFKNIILIIQWLAITFCLPGDGFTEIVSAGYTAGEVYVYTFAP